MTTPEQHDQIDPRDAYRDILTCDPAMTGRYGRIILDSGDGLLISDLAVSMSAHGLEVDGISVEDCQEAVIASGDGEAMYDFATCVPGADVDRLSWETGRTGDSAWITAFAHIDDEPDDEDWW